MMTRTLHFDLTANRTAMLAMLVYLTATAAHAQTLAHETFNYSPGSSFGVGGTTTNTGSGFTGNVFWDFGTPTASIINGGSLSYNDGSASLVIANNYYENGHGRLALNLNVSVGGPFASYLESGRIGANGTTIYLSFLYRNTTASAAGFSGFELFRGSSADPNRVLSANAWTGHSAANFHLTVGEGANGGAWGGGAASATNANLGFINSTVNFFVIRLDFGTGTDTATFYANPLLSAEPGSPTGQVSAGDLSFDRIANSVFSGAPPIFIDEIRVGTSYAAVTAIPEPGVTVLFAGAAALGLIAFRRRVLAWR